MQAESIKLDFSFPHRYRTLAKQEGRTIKGQIEIVLRDYLRSPEPASMTQAQKWIAKRKRQGSRTGPTSGS